VPTAVIDIGTNTLLLLIVDEQCRRIVDLCRFGRLGKGLDASGEIASESIAASLEICREYRAVMDAHGIAAPGAIVGTQALREAKNATAFVAPAEAILGARIEIIAGAREAELAFTSVARTFPERAGTPYLVVDVGGGSTEIITTMDGVQIATAVSVPIGAVRLAERHGTEVSGCGPKRFLDKAARDALPRDLPVRVPIIATAGTATTMAAVALGLSEYDSDRVTGFRMTSADVQAMHYKMIGATVEQRRAMPGMEPGRADVIHGGVVILNELVKRVEAPVLITCDRGVRWGLAFELATTAARAPGDRA
jgi:exopolyphosphatase / guanosine-5'-triphosphate,3'-diphosphate pyrophosphatase